MGETRETSNQDIEEIIDSNQVQKKNKSGIEFTVRGISVKLDSKERKHYVPSHLMSLIESRIDSYGGSVLIGNYFYLKNPDDKKIYTHTGKLVLSEK